MHEVRASTKKKVALIYSAFPPCPPWARADGGAFYVQRLAEKLSEHFEVHVITVAESPGPISEVAKVERIHRVLPSWRLRNTIQGMRVLKSSLSKIEPDATIVVFPGGGVGCKFIVPCFSRFLSPKTRLITMVFSVVPGRHLWNLPLFLLSSFVLFLSSDELCFESPWHLRKFRTVLRHRAAHMRLIPTGITLDIHDSFSAARLPERRRALGLDPVVHVAVLGAWTRNKNLDIVIRALGLLKSSRRVKLLFVGGRDRSEMTSKYERQMLELLDRIQLSADVVFTGHVSDELFVNYMLASDVCVLPFDGKLGRSTLFAAMTAGMPIVMFGDGADVPMQGNQSVCFAREATPAALASAVSRVIDDDELKESLGRSAAKVSARYAWPTLVDLWRGAISAETASTCSF